jgi:hypothetical protein
MNQIYTVDQERLAEANKFIHGVMEANGMERSSVYDLVRQALESKGDLYNNLNQESKDAIKSNIDLIQYVASHENEFIKQAMELLPIVARQMGSPEVSDDMNSCGMMAIRRAYFYYDTTVCNLKRFCYAGIQQEYRQLLRVSKFHKNSVWRSRVHIDTTNAETLAPEYHTTEPTEESDSVLESAKLAGLSPLEIINKVADGAKFDSNERKLFEIMLRDGCNRNWVNQYLKETGLTMTKQGVYYKRDMLIKRLQSEINKNGNRLFN